MVRGDKSARKTLTPKGAATREKLLMVAKQVFEQGNYHEASVSEICRRARVANGTFYQYFNSKEEVLLELAARLSEQLRVELAAALHTDGDLEARLLRALRIFISFIRENRALYQIFREIEFVNKRAHNQFYEGLAKLFAQFFAEGHHRGELRPVDFEVAAVAVIGVAHFLVLQWLILGPGDVPEEALKGAVDLIFYGVDTGRPLRARSRRPTAPPSRRAAVNETPLTRGEETRRKLLNAAEACFSRYGFYATSVADITRRAGVSLGAFYLYFPSKTEILAELVRDINARLRRNARAAIAGLTDRREIEREGFRAFFQFVSQNMEAYRIVREAEFVHPPIARWYFERLAHGYIKGLRTGMRRREIRQSDAETLAYCLMGIGHFLGLRWAAWSKQSPMPKHAFDRVIDLILHGLKGSLRRYQQKPFPSTLSSSP
jgi:AcrR family transcriptional regulator